MITKIEREREKRREREERTEIHVGDFIRIPF
jgi:hypothetical protein